MKNILIFILLVIVSDGAFAQFAPAAGEPGSTAIYKDNISFAGWAKSCKVSRGFINISDTTVTYSQNSITSNRAFFGAESVATGKAAGALDCISLGDGGSAVLTFDFPLRNGEGFDFAVFENGMKEQTPPYLYFLELAFVEVSTDGRRFVRFPSVSNTQNIEQITSFEQIDPAKINNLAGKYLANYGTPFDLEELKDSTGINLDSINFIRIVDVVGSINTKYASFDSQGQIINDPFPTEFWSGGFDLDAVGAIHLNGITGFHEKTQETLHLFPNPVNSGNTITLAGVQNSHVELWSPTGCKIKEWNTLQAGENELTMSGLKKGIYLISVHSGEKHETIKLMVE